MSRYIDADKIEWRLIIPTNATTAEENMIYHARKLVESQPTADVVEVVHGEWKPNSLNGFKIYDCSNCGIHMEAKWDYCPNCGAKMDERRNNELHK